MLGTHSEERKKGLTGLESNLPPSGGLLHPASAHWQPPSPLAASEPTSKWLLESLYWQKCIKLLRSEMAEVLENLDSGMEKIAHPNHAFSQGKQPLKGGGSF